jgi:cystathionine beta-synthase
MPTTLHDLPPKHEHPSLALRYKTLLQMVGNTPMIQLELGTTPLLLAKLEYLNPGGSIKDRTALYMVEQAEKKGLLLPGGTIIEASSGNQGIALAMIGALKGYKVIITVPARTSVEKRSTLQAYGAQVVACDGANGKDYHDVAVELTATIPGAFMPNQYFNPDNLAAHYASTGPEIWNQTNGLVTHVIVGAGSCGTISGIGRYLKEQNPDVQVIGVDAATSAYSSPNPTPYITEGLGIDYTDGILDRSVVDRVFPITDEQAFDETRRLAQKHGILVGPSSGAVVYAARQISTDLPASAVVVVILADSGRAYLSKVFGL